MIINLITIGLLVLVLYPLLIYPCILYVWAKLKKNRSNKSAAPSQTSVSILVPMYNEEKGIRKKIENCLSFDYPQDKIEIVLGSDGSTDSTNKILEEYAACPNVKI